MNARAFAFVLLALAACSPYKGKTTRSAAQWTALLEQAVATRQVQLRQCHRYLPAEIERAEVTVTLREDEGGHTPHELRVRAHNAGTRELDGCTRDALDVLMLPNTDDSHLVGGQWTVVYDRHAPFEPTPNQLEPLREAPVDAPPPKAAADAAQPSEGETDAATTPSSSPQ